MKAEYIIRIITFLLIFAFLIIGGLLAIIIGQGNTLNKDGSITLTSIIQVNSVPTDVEVYLDGKKVSLSDRKIEWIEPGLKTLKLVKSGYKDWEKTVKVEPGIIKEVNAQLYPEKLKFEKLTNVNINKVFFSNSFDFAYFTVLDNIDSTKNGLWRLKLSKNFLDFGTNSPILISNLTEYVELLKENEYNITISSDNNKVLFQIPKKEIISIIEVNRQNQSTDLKLILGYYPDFISWFRDSNSIVIEKNNLLFEYEISTAQKSIIDFSFDKKLVYSINLNYILYQNTQNKKLYTYSNKTSNILNEDLVTEEDLMNLTGFETMQSTKDILIIKFDSSFKYINFDKKFTEVIKNVDSIKKVSLNARVILFEREGNLFTYSLENTPDTLSFVSTINQIQVKPSLIQSTYFSPNSRTLLFKLKHDDLTLNIVSFDIDGNNKIEILKDERIDNSNEFIFSSDSTQLYLLLKEKGINDEYNTNLFEIGLISN